MTTPDRIRPIHDEAAYQAAPEAYEAFFDSEPEPGTEAGDAFELLGMVIAKLGAVHTITIMARVSYPRRSSAPRSSAAGRISCGLRGIC